jgi:branched-chain amino acid transport system permease protein
VTVPDFTAESASLAQNARPGAPKRRSRPSQAVFAAIGGLVALVVISVVSWAGYQVTFEMVLVNLITGISLGAIYAMAASGVVVTYTATGIFNFAQGAMGMLMAFVFWEFSVNHGMQRGVALALTVFVVAPLFGALLDVVLMRRLVGTTLVVQLVVTVGLMFFLIGLAQTLWEPTEPRTLTFFFGLSGFHVGQTLVLWHRALAIAMAGGIAIGLRLLLHRTRIGVTMRAVVDNRDLSALHGARPNRVSMLAWALSTSLAALAGIMLAPETNVDAVVLTFLTVSAFAAAVVGRLRSLPWTFAGAMVLGIVITYSKNFLSLGERWYQLPEAIPSLFLLAALLALPMSRLAFARLGGRGQPRATRTTTVREGAAGMALVFIAILAISSQMGQVDLNRLTLAIVTAILLLSFVPLTGWAGYVSLAQITFAGIGAFTMWKVAGSTGNPLGLLVAAAVAVPFGLLMALPALRLSGLYLALASLAFALLGEYLLFPQTEVSGIGGARQLTRPTVFGIDFADQRNFLLAATALFGILAVGVIWMRRGRFGRRLIAIRDSEAASATLGGNPLVTKLAVFGLSAAIAGFAGGLLALHRTSATAQDYAMLAGIPLLLLVVVGGVERVSGALFGGIASVLLVIIQDQAHLSILQHVEVLGPGLLALGVVSNPDGAVVAIGAAFAPLLPWRKDARDEATRRKLQKRAASEQPNAADATSDHVDST